MAGFVRDALAALLSGTFSPLEATDFLQNGEAARWPLGGVALWAGAPLDLSESKLQAGQWVISVFVLVSVVPLLIVQSRRLAVVTGNVL